MAENYSFNGTEGAMISKQTAELYLLNYKQGPSYTWNQGIKAHFFGRDILEELLSQNGAMGLRIYYGSKVNANNVLVPEIVIVAADSSGNDILNNNKIADVSRPCPPYCHDTGLGT